MADKRIRDLTNETTAPDDDTDVGVVDSTTGGTSRITRGNLLGGSPTAEMNIGDLTVTDSVDFSALEGWLTAGLTGVAVTRQSTDNPTVVLRFDADVTDYIWKGMRIKATENSIVHYFIVSADPAYSDPNTDVTCLSEIDTSTPTQAENLIGSGAISDVAYAPPKTFPKGFPIDVQSWEMVVKDTTSVSQSSPTGGTWYNLGSISIDLPIGNWGVSYRATLYGAGSSDEFMVFATLSTANNSESDAEFTVTERINGYTGGGTRRFQTPAYTEKPLSIASKSTRYLNSKSDASIAAISFRGQEMPTIIRATSTLL